MDKPISLLILEDDENDCAKFRNYIKDRNDIRIIANTDSELVALQYVKTYQPQAIIVDIELNHESSIGSGITFLEKLKTLILKVRPIIIVTTKICSDLTYKRLHQLGADVVFYKSKADYCVEMVIENILALRPAIDKVKLEDLQGDGKEEIAANSMERLSDMINTELDLIGISRRLKGRKLIFDGLIYLLQGENRRETVYNYLSNKYKRANSSICRTIQTAIYNAWRTAAIEDIETHYTQKYSHERGVPIPTELLFYYEEKISKQLQ
ncbi:MAG: response regulator [Clostridia bacterium]|nr:response regulator [Clostridia bacterium]